MGAQGLVALLVLIAGACRGDDCGDVYTRSKSPNGRFEIVVCREAQAFAAPGQGGDAPGTIRLVEVATGRILQATSIDLVQSFPGATWESGRVDLLPLVQWDLPP